MWVFVWERERECVCVCERERESERDARESRLSGESAESVCISESESSGCQ